MTILPSRETLNMFRRALKSRLRSRSINAGLNNEELMVGSMERDSGSMDVTTADYLDALIDSTLGIEHWVTSAGLNGGKWYWCIQRTGDGHHGSFTAAKRALLADMMAMRRELDRAIIEVRRAPKREAVTYGEA